MNLPAPHLRDDLDWLVAREKERWAFQHAILKKSGDPIASFLTGTNVELIYASVSSGTAKASFTTEVAINDTTGMGVQPYLPKGFWLPAKGDLGRGIRIEAAGILSCTGTPTYTWTVRGGTVANTSAAILLGSAALTTASGITNKQWFLVGNVFVEAIGAAGANSTIRGVGQLESFGGLASPFGGELWGGGAQPGTAATFDTSIDNFINFNVACSASSASNSITINQLLVWGLN